ncbi:hypothetical protein [Enterobacter cloacae]
MTDAKKNKHIDSSNNNDNSHDNKKKCFIIMPIADHADYPTGHFQRVYDYLIKPACDKAGLEAYRADDNKASDMIMLDILQQLVECDMAICDISSRNANVFFELGLRQAFNKKTILITDGLQNAPFDISGLRHVTYSPTLRVDTVAKEVPEITNMLIDTENLPDNKVNSIVNLLQIKPAKVETKDLSPLDTVIFDMFSQLKEQINNISTVTLQSTISPKQKRNISYNINSDRMLIVTKGLTFKDVYDDLNPAALIGSWEHRKPSPNSRVILVETLGTFIGKQDDTLLFELDSKVKRVEDTPKNRSEIIAV